MKYFITAAMSALALAACRPQVAQTALPDTPVTYTASDTLAQALPELSAALASGDLTSVALTQAYLDRIAAVDRAGPTLQAVLALNPDAIAQATASDARRANDETLGPLDGIPLLFKDNIETLDPIATTAGALALKDNITGRDSPLVANLRAQGAVILGKTNLSQWANFRSNSSLSGWSALGGQVRNPHMLDRNPCGSSSGSGAAAAASLAAGAVGTETNGSIICPANVNGVVGFKPTVGLVSADLIVPISPSQDTAGPMTKSVRGAAMMLDGMTGRGDTFTAALNANDLSGARVGVLRFAEGSNSDIQDRFTAALAEMETAGATLVEIESFDPDVEAFWGKALDVLQYEFKDSLNAYLADAAPDVTARTLTDIIAFNRENSEIELALFDQDILEASNALGPLTDETYTTARDEIQVATRANGIDRLLAEYNVDMLVSPSGPLSPRVDPVNGDVWPDWAGAGWIAAIAGYPHVTVPMGDVHGIPIGLSIMGAKDADAAVLSWGYAYEQVSQNRVAPQYLPNAEARPEIAAAMKAK
jgi:amidase